MKTIHLIAMAVLLGGGWIWYGIKVKEERVLRAELRVQCLALSDRAEQLCLKDYGSERNEASQALGAWLARAEAAGLPEVAEVRALRQVVANGAGAEKIRGRVQALSR